MARFTEINYQGSLKGTDYMWGVHAAGCQDIVKEANRVFGYKQDPETFRYIFTEHEASSMRELLDLIVDGEMRELGYHNDNVKVHNCVAKALRASKKPTLIDVVNQPENAAKMNEAIRGLVNDVLAASVTDYEKVQLARMEAKRLSKRQMVSRKRGAGGRYVK